MGSQTSLCPEELVARPRKIRRADGVGVGLSQASPGPADLLGKQLQRLTPSLTPRIQLWFACDVHPPP